MSAAGLQRVEEAIASIAAGRMVLVVDDEDRENEGDLIIGASFATSEAMAFYLHHTSGYICVAMTAERLDALQIPPMVEAGMALFGESMTVTVDARGGGSTGISAVDRARTIRRLADVRSEPHDFARPGHVQPLRAMSGGVLERTGHTEAGVDLARLAGIEPAAAICEVVTADKLGMARHDELEALAQQYSLPLISIADLVEYRTQVESGVVQV